MNDAILRTDVERPQTTAGPTRTGVKLAGVVAAAALIGGGVLLAPHLFHPAAASAAAPPPAVGVSQPLQRALTGQLQFLGQFAPVNQVELRAQVGGALTQIGFKDGDIVQKGALLFVIDPEPYQIKLAQGQAQLESANARLDLATRELARAEQLKSIDAGSTENVDQRRAEKAAALAAVDAARAVIRDARFDLDHTRVTAPFTGRIGTHLVSVGNLVAGSRAAGSPTTLLATIVSTDPIWFNFDMSEADYATYQQARASVKGPIADQIELAANGETRFSRPGTLTFLDNTLDRSSGTIHARATVPNADYALTPGGFARVQLAVSKAAPVLLVPDAAVLSDQADHMVLTVGKDNIVTPKKVEVGDLRGGLRVVRSGLSPSDRVIIDGIPSARPGSPITPQAGSIRFDPSQG